MFVDVVAEQAATELHDSAVGRHTFRGSQLQRMNIFVIGRLPMSCVPIPRRQAGATLAGRDCVSMRPIESPQVRRFWMPSTANCADATFSAKLNPKAGTAPHVGRCLLR